MVLAVLFAVASSQVAIAQQPDFATMLATVKEARAKRPLDARALVAIKQGPIEPTLAADLLANDWLTVGAWSFPEKSFNVRYEPEEEFQFDLRRFLPDGQELSYNFVVNRREPTKGELTHINFQLPSPQVVSFKKLGKQLYLERIAYGSKELHRVVQYEKGVLIIDISFDGVPNSKKVKFRDVWIAMPRKFESTGT